MAASYARPRAHVRNRATLGRHRERKLAITAGQVLGNYRIVEEIAHGGMATVYLANHQLLGRAVAIKVISAVYSGEPTFMARFRHEAALVANLRHPHILTVYDFGESDGMAYLVMELVDGGTLRDRMGVALSVSQTCGLLRPVASALDYAHSRGIVHRDFKPSNVLLHRDGTPILADFGLARVLESVDTRLTMTGQLMGTPSYMAPEQALGQEVGAYTDVYALTAVAYEMLTGTVPYSAPTPVGVMMAHVSDPLPRARDRNPLLTEDVELVLGKGMAKAPNHRYQTAGELVEALERVPAAAAEPAATIVAPIPGATSIPPVQVPLPAAPIRSRVPVIAGGAALAVLIVAAAVFFAIVMPSLNGPGPATATATLVVALPQPTATPQPIALATSVPPTPIPTAVPPTPRPSPTPAPTWVVISGGPLAGADPGKFNQPMGVRLDARGNLWVVENSGDRIQELSATGEPIAQFGTKGNAPGEFDGLSGIALDDAGNIYITQWGPTNPVQKISPTGESLAAWGKKGNAPGEFDFPSGIAVDRDGNVYVADHNNNRIQKLSSKGEPLEQWGTPGGGPGEFNHPGSVALDAQGNIYVADIDNHRIQKLSPSGQSLAIWGKKGNQPGEFDRPAEVELDKAGALYVVDTNNSRVQKLSPTGEFIAQWGTGGNGPGQFKNLQDIAIDPEGNLFVADMDNHRIQKLPLTAHL